MRCPLEYLVAIQLSSIIGDLLLQRAFRIEYVSFVCFFVCDSPLKEVSRKRVTTTTSLISHGSYNIQSNTGIEEVQDEL